VSDSSSQREPSKLSSLLLGDRYKLLRQIGEGGTSQVYEAEHQLTGERVALKVIPLKRVGDEKTIGRFLREAKLTQGLNHPGFVQILDAWIDSNQRCCLVMERLYGESLRELMSQQKITRREALEVIQALLEPLALAHERGIIHRDLKPENIFIHRPEGEGRSSVVKLLDFGLSRSAISPSVTYTGQFVGTPWYISPEQAFSPKDCEASADIWSIGVILYELLSDQVPFNGDSLPMICMSIKQDPHPALSELNADVHPALVDLIDRCLSKSPQDRPQDATALLASLKALNGQLFVGREGAEHATSGAIRGTPATIDVSQYDQQELELSHHAERDAELSNHDTRSEPSSAPNNALSESPVEDQRSTAQLSVDEIEERLAALDFAHQAELLNEPKMNTDELNEALALEVGPTAVGTLNVIDWPDEMAEDSVELHELETNSVTSRDELLKLIKDPLMESELDSDALTNQIHEPQTKMDTLRGNPQVNWGEGELLGADLIDDDISVASDVISAIDELSDPELPARLTAPLTSQAHSTMLHGTPQLNVHREETAIQDKPEAARRPQRAQSVANAPTQRQGLSPFAGQTLDFSSLDETESGVVEQHSERHWSSGYQRSELEHSDLEHSELEHSELEHSEPERLMDRERESGEEGSPLLWISVLIFISALSYALSARIF